MSETIRIGKYCLPIFIGGLIILGSLGMSSFHYELEGYGVQSFGYANNFLMPIDIYLPSESTEISGGVLAIRIYAPSSSEPPRYLNGAPILIWAPGGDSPGQLANPLIATSSDIVVITFLFPGGHDYQNDHRSDGTYDHRGPNCIAALRDVIRYAMGELMDTTGRIIDDAVPVPILHNNIGLLGSSNGGNIVMAVAAEYGNHLSGHLRYIIQWESPVSSQIATVDLGRIVLECPPWEQGTNDFVNPRYLSYGPLTLNVDYSDVMYDPKNNDTHVFHDGNKDGQYTTVRDPVTGCQTPDLDGDGILEINEDFPLRSYTDGIKQVYSRQVTESLRDNHVLTSPWPSDIANVDESAGYWGIREAVHLYDTAVTNIPDLKGMILASTRDHVQSPPDKPHIRQAFEGWNYTGAWVKINPAPAYLSQVDSRLAHRFDLPSNIPNIPPSNWNNDSSYCIPEDIPDGIYELAAVWEMADLAYTESGYVIQITNLTGGIGISAGIRNSGKTDVQGIKWSMDIAGRIIYGNHWNGVVNLPAGKEVTVKSGLLWGIGPGTITVACQGNFKSAECTILGPFVVQVK